MTKLSALTKSTTGLNSGATLLAEKMETGSIATSDIFKSLIPINENDLREITQSMKDNGYDQSKPLHIWKEKNILVDGHTRLAAALDAGIAEVPVYKHSFETESEAIEYAIKEQLNRRNLDDAGKLILVAKLDRLKNPGRKADLGERGKSAEKLAEQIGTSTRQVERMRAVIDNEEEFDAVVRGEKSMNRAYEDSMEKKRAAKAEALAAEEKELNDLPFSNEELSKDEGIEAEADAAPDKSGGLDSGDAFDVFGDEDDDEEYSEATGGIDLASLISDCMKIAERYGLEVEEDGCKTSPLDERIIYSACIRFSLAGKVINPQILL